MTTTDTGLTDLQRELDGEPTALDNLIATALDAWHSDDSLRIGDDAYTTCIYREHGSFTEGARARENARISHAITAALADDRARLVAPPINVHVGTFPLAPSGNAVVVMNDDHGVETIWTAGPLLRDGTRELLPAVHPHDPHPAGCQLIAQKLPRIQRGQGVRAFVVDNPKDPSTPAAGTSEAARA